MKKVVQNGFVEIKKKWNGSNRRNENKFREAFK